MVTAGRKQTWPSHLFASGAAFSSTTPSVPETPMAWHLGAPSTLPSFRVGGGGWINPCGQKVGELASS